MKSRLLAATAILSIAVSASAQSFRTMSITGAPVLGATFNAVLTYPPAAAGNIYGFMWSDPFPGSFPLVVPGFTFVSDCRIDLGTMNLFNVGIYDASGTTSMAVAVPSSPSVIGAALDCQGLDVDITQTFYLSDNDVAIVVSAGLGQVEITSATTVSTTAGNNNTHSITNATIGAPVSYGQPLFSYLPVRHRGEDGTVEGYAGTFSGTSHNSDIDSVSYRRPGRRTANGAYQTIGLKNGYEVAIIRDLVNPKQFSLTSYNQATGATVVIPGSTWVDTSATAAPVQQNFYFGVSRNNDWGSIYVKDSNTTPGFLPKVWAFRTDGSAPVVDVTPVGTLLATPFFDGTLAFTNDFMIASGVNGLFWTSATAPATMVPLVMPNTTFSNLPNVWAFPLSWRVSADGTTGYLPLSSNTLASRGEMDMAKLTNNAGVPLVVNYTQFPVATGMAEFGYSAITPAAAANNSSTGIKCSVSPDGAKVAFLAATTVATVFPGLYVADGTANPVLYTVPGAVSYTEVAFINNTTVLFFAGAVPAAGVGQGFYKLDLTAGNQLGVITQIGAAINHRTRGQFWSLNRNWWYFVRSNFASNVNDIVGVNCATGTVYSVTGTEFGTPGPVGTIRTGSFNTTADPWFALEMQLRRAPVGDFAYFTARREVAGMFEDSNVFRFDIENGGQAVMLTNNVGVGAAAANVLNIESLTISADGNHVAYGQRLGTTSTVTTPENVFHLNLTGNVVTQCSTSNPLGQTITDGSIRFVGGATPNGLVWSLGTGAATTVSVTNAIVQYAALGSSTPYTISAPPAGTRLYQVIGTH